VPVTVVVRPGARAVADASLRRQAVARVRAALAVVQRQRASVALVFTDDGDIRGLNRRYRKIDRATDVLSFEGGAGELGDIVISVETARRQADRRRGGTRRALGRELEVLAVHGLCHLLGHDHKRPAPARLMRSLERRLLRASL